MKTINYFKELSELISIKSISTLKEYSSEMERAVFWLKEKLEKNGFKTEIYKRNGHPILFGSIENQKNKKTVLIYGHYDVQPPDPLEEWKTDPFTLSEDEDFLYARGVSDDKGQLFVHIKALENYKEKFGEIPFNVKIVLEGEEEIGSPSLPEFLKEYKNKLKADFAIISDNPMLGRGMPSLSYGLRGLLYAELKVLGPKNDLHSGRFGGAIPNPAFHLCRALSSIKGRDGKIKIKGFYDDVIPLKDEEKINIKNLPIGNSAYKKMAVVSKLETEKGFSAIEAIWARPSFDINGITSGFQGEGSKTIIPSFALAKISFRLVPNQKPEKVFELLKFHLEKNLKRVNFELKMKESASPVLVDINNPYLQKVKNALEKGFEKKVYLIRQGGTIPVVSLIQKELDIPVILMGLGLPDENAHGPNEKLLKENFIKGIKSLQFLYDNL